MSWNDDPPRLLDGGGDEPLRALLQAGRDELPSQEQLQALATRLGPWMGGPGGGGGAPSGAAGGSAATLPFAKVIVAMAIGGAALAGGAYALRSNPSTSGSAGAYSAPSPEPSIASPALPSVEPAVASAAQSETPKVAPSPPRPTATASSGAEEGLSETALLQQAQGALGAEPMRALALTQEHARRFPAGALSQEREAIAIQALVGLGRTPEARARAERFARAFPGSAYVRRFEVLIGPLQGDAGR